MRDDIQSALVTRLGQLPSDQRLTVFELFAHNLTIAARGAWADSALSTKQQVQALKTINECLHKATSRVQVERLGTRKWTDEDFVGMVADCEAVLHSALQGSLGWALEASLGHVEAKARR